LFAVGTELVTSRDDPAMNGVYKLVAIRNPTLPPTSSSPMIMPNYKIKAGYYENGIGGLIYKTKTSPGKKMYPGPKQIHRILSDNLLKFDLVALDFEDVDSNNSIPLLRKYTDKGEILEEMPSIQAIRESHLQQLNVLPSKFKDLYAVPKRFPVKFSKKLVMLLNEISHKKT
jgi:nicotinate phosphoribosyltransferase